MSATQMNKSAQLAADLDNYQSTLDIPGSNTPIAINNKTNMPILRGLYPK